MWATGPVCLQREAGLEVNQWLSGLVLVKAGSSCLHYLPTASFVVGFEEIWYENRPDEFEGLLQMAVLWF